MQMRTGAIHVWAIAVLMVIGLVSHGTARDCDGCGQCAQTELSFAEATDTAVEATGSCKHSCCSGTRADATDRDSSDNSDPKPADDDGCPGGCHCPTGCCNGLQVVAFARIATIEIDPIDAEMVFSATAPEVCARDAQLGLLRPPQA